ncbi:hypothetical protein D9757_002482 [Collybiopsis confluens]|uniref:Uncharacterized protein n=1 Tax=Collybiopsis confluens TaxID=2823264 RepID=A0A8H5HVK4_9AGAR|nr:hypothetical protein D9757_005279 [Collybiopsis confluens]KAF5391663.1 hypothetical protein D9757_002482 [Collybiopsis confluens]
MSVQSPITNISVDDAFAGVHQMINDSNSLQPADIIDDLEEAKDHVGFNAEEDGTMGDTRLSFNGDDLKASLKEISKGVSEKTAAEYKRLINQCDNFVHKHNMLPQNSTLFSDKPHPQTAEFLVAWIMNSCDEVNLDGTPKEISLVRHKYGHAQKMRAAAMFAFGRLHGLGTVMWHRSEVTGKMTGNPASSETVSTYMLSLRRRKTLKGETSNSARAVTSALLSKLYHFNCQPQFQEPKMPERSKQGAPRVPTDWAGPRARALINLGYALAFCGLLRVDELMHIQCQDIELQKDPNTQKYKITLRLPFRKTAQFGDVQPFVWHELPDAYAHICVIRALAQWINITKMHSGYLFRKIRANDRIAEGNEPMESDQFLEMFRNNLLDIGVDHAPYGTHSFRRGGCQFLSTELRWSLRQICEWGGWSMEYTNLTIVKYLISSNDNPTMSRDDFFNLERKPAVVCPMCGRSCHCA